MSENSVTVFVVMNDDLRQAEASLKSLASQAHSDLEVACVFAGKNDASFAEAARLAHVHFPLAQIVRAPSIGDVPQTLNTLIEKTTAPYVSLLTTGDIYHPERLKLCIAAARDRQCAVMITHAELLDYAGNVIASDHKVFKDYTHGLLSNIASHPCLSFTILWNDLIVSPGNIFCGTDLFRAVGGFNNFENLFVYDLFLRMARHEEPALITEKMISCRPIFTDHKLKENKTVEGERAIITRAHLLALLAKPPANIFSDVFTAHPFMFAGAPWSLAISSAVDGMIEMRLPPQKTKHAAAGPDRLFADNDKTITLLTHELTLTGAPVIVLELAALLRDLGYAITVISPSDGPLRKDFESRGIKVVLLPNIHPRLQSLENFLLARLESRRELIGFCKRFVFRSLRVFRKILLLRAKWKLSELITSNVLINSVAAWQWTYFALQKNATSVTWYVHETFDPKWMASVAADKLFRQRIAEGRLSMFYGSEATRKAWALEGYPGQVKYWSGIKSDTYPGHQIKSLLPGKDKRVILNVGSVGARKGTRVLLEAFALGRQQGIIPDDVELCIVGCPLPSANQEARDIVMRAHKADLQGSVRIVGHLYPDAISSYYDEADIYVHASFFDCMPIALLTAMVRGLPIAATNVDGCGEAIIDEVSGLLVPPRSPQLLANAMARLLKDKPMAEQVARGARDRFVRTFSVEATFEPLLKEIG
jgi:glycosyltransferase involved in cell wall biosynthesis